MGDGEAREALDDDGEGASCRAQAEYQEQCEDMEPCVVCAFARLGPARRPFVSSLELRPEQFSGQACDELLPSARHGRGWARALGVLAGQESKGGDFYGFSG